MNIKNIHKERKEVTNIYKMLIMAIWNIKLQETEFFYFIIDFFSAKKLIIKFPAMSFLGGNLK